MGKWLDQSKYEDFARTKQNEKEKAATGGGNNFYRIWKPEMGSEAKAKEYEMRVLPNPGTGGIYEKYMYHGFMVGEKFNYFLCRKTNGLHEYCPWCEVSNILYQGNDSDKKRAGEIRRKNRFVGNIFVVDDPRDAETKDEKFQVNGKVVLFQFPGTVESKINNEITNTRDGYGGAIFDPEDGYNLVVSVKAKPKDQYGKVWPDYGDTMFTRSRSAIGDDAAVEAAMESRYDLNVYLKTLDLSNEDHITLLKAEMVWEDVKFSFEKNMMATTTEVAETPATPATPAPQEDDTPDRLEQSSAPSDQDAPPAGAAQDDTDTQALLKELEDL